MPSRRCAESRRCGGFGAARTLAGPALLRRHGDAQNSMETASHNSSYEACRRGQPSEHGKQAVHGQAFGLKPTHDSRAEGRRTARCRTTAATSAPACRRPQEPRRAVAHALAEVIALAVEHPVEGIEAQRRARGLVDGVTVAGLHVAFGHCQALRGTVRLPPQIGDECRPKFDVKRAGHHAGHGASHAAGRRQQNSSTNEDAMDVPTTKNWNKKSVYERRHRIGRTVQHQTQYWPLSVAASARFANCVTRFGER
jgi:hypothetical protein